MLSGDPRVVMGHDKKNPGRNVTMPRVGCRRFFSECEFSIRAIDTYLFQGMGLGITTERLSARPTASMVSLRIGCYSALGEVPIRETISCSSVPVRVTNLYTSRGSRSCAKVRWVLAVGPLGFHDLHLRDYLR
jgi:hypothetical protein